MEKANFVDYVKMHCVSGNGGAGSAHMRREKFVPKGGPDGGDGGRGGDIILKGNKQLWTLIHLKYQRHVKAGHGKNGMKQLKSGAAGEDVILEVPIGTIARDAETREIEFEIIEDGQEVILMKGGMGGLGNHHFKTSTNQTPRYAQSGKDGEEAWKILELKVLADVGLVGFPNAGKSTLLSVISAAKPKIASYAFTTLVPNLGVVPYRDSRSFVVADIPGIIENAHLGKGLGHRFLRHIERNSILLFMIPIDTDDVVKEYHILINELMQYNPELLDKEKILAITKCDMADTEMEQLVKNTMSSLSHIPTVFISSVANQNIDQLKDVIWQALTQPVD